MNKLSKVILVIALITSINAKSQDNCEKLLQDGLYKKFKFNKKKTFDEDIKNYFLSDYFKEDLKTGKWGGAAFGLSASSSNEEISRVQQKLIASNSFSFRKEFHDSSILYIPDIELAKTYVDCLNGNFGFKVNPIISRNNVVFKVTYYNKIPTDPMPVLQNLSILGATEISSPINKGEKIFNETPFSCSRDSKTDMIFVLLTDRGTAIYSVPADVILDTVINKVEINDEAKRELTNLMFSAICTGDIKTFISTIKKGADINEKRANDNGNTALHYAVIYGCKFNTCEIISYLSKHAKHLFNEKNFAGQIAMDMAKQSQANTECPKAISIYQCLLEYAK